MPVLFKNDDVIRQVRLPENVDLALQSLAKQKYVSPAIAARMAIAEHLKAIGLLDE